MRRQFFVPLLAAVLAPCAALAQTAERSRTPAPVKAPFDVSTYAEGLVRPWSLAFLPDGRALATERAGRLRLVASDGRVSEPLKGTPRVFAQGQGGLLDVAVDPKFAENQTIYLSYSEPGDGGAGTAVARARLSEGGLEDVKVVWRQTPKVNGPNHWGSRIVFRPDGTMFVTVGDRYNYKERAQTLSNTIGKVVRITAEGEAPKDNPFVGRDDAKPEIWSYGHRNVQAAALDSEGRLWTVEHGARGGDELNQPEAGKNYGWPVITYGVDYSGERIGEGTAKRGLEQPVFYWDPVIAPSGAIFYTGDAFADWKGDLFVGGLRTQALVRLEIRDGQVASETRYDLDRRIRDVQQGPDGAIYVVTDEERGQILKLQPAATR